ncbi:MAG: SPFH domain-containing protein [Mogibacterium sp.]|nr:SPFH domain-containing protein [Mogibacterium sp.]
MNKEYVNVEQRILNPPSGIVVLILLIAACIFSVVGFVAGIAAGKGGLVLLCILLWCVLPFLFAGLRSVRPNEALVLTLFGKYYGTINKPGYFFVNPFARYNNPAYEAQAAAAAKETADAMIEGKAKTRSARTSTNRIRKTVSLKRSTLDNGTQKVNDALGNPVIIGAVVLWHVEDPTKAVFNVENYTEFLSIQTDSTIRNTARLYPYDIFDDGLDDDNDGKAEQTLRGSSQEIAEKMKVELAEKVAFAGLVVEEVRITHLSYAEEIAAAMLQRQQASAIIAARTKIVDGAVSMVKMAIDKLNEDDIVTLDEERKAQMVSNLLVVLCGNKDAQPIVNSGSIY